MAGRPELHDAADDCTGRLMIRRGMDLRSDRLRRISPPFAGLMKHESPGISHARPGDFLRCIIPFAGYPLRGGV
jgi:hypothetical protein